MGMLPRACLSSVIKADPVLVWEIPDEWTLEEVVTIPVVYATVSIAPNSQSLQSDESGVDLGIQFPKKRHEAWWTLGLTRLGYFPCAPLGVKKCFTQEVERKRAFKVYNVHSKN